MSLAEYEAFVYRRLPHGRRRSRGALARPRPTSRRRADRAGRRARAARRRARHRPPRRRRRAARGSPPTDASTCRTARSSRARSRPRPRARSASRSRRSSRATRSRTSGCASRAAASSRRRRRGAQTYLARCSTLDGARACSARSPSGSTTRSTASRATSSSTRRSAGRCTSRSAPASPRRAGENSSGLHWDLICDLRADGEVYADGELVWKAGRSSTRPGAGRSRRPSACLTRRVERLAEVAVGYSTGRAPGRPRPHRVDARRGAARARDCTARVLAAGGHPYVRLTARRRAGGAPPSTAATRSSSWLSPARTDEIERADVRIFVDADENTRALTGVDPARQALAQQARKPLRRPLFERAAAGELRWLVTLFPTQAAAQDAGMSLTEYEDFVYAAGHLDAGRPGRGLARRSASAAAHRGSGSASKRELRIVAEGTDLTPRRRRPHVDHRADGTENFPDGEVFTGPVETSADGTIRFSFPARPRARGRGRRAALRGRRGRAADGARRARRSSRRCSAWTTARAAWASSPSA